MGCKCLQKLGPGVTGAIITLLMLFTPAKSATITNQTEQGIERVVCKSDPQQSYFLFLPSNYSPARKWPILYAFDPLARGKLPVTLFKNAAEKYGYIVVGSNNSRNGIEVRTFVMTLWSDTHERLSIDENRVYATGFSGGARVAIWMASANPKLVAGVIACSGGFPIGIQPDASTQFMIFATTGTKDFNFPEMQQLKRKLDGLQVTNHLTIFDGEHQWAPPEVCLEALSWLEIQTMKKGTRPKDESLIDQLFLEQTRLSRERESAQKNYEAFLDYRAIADEFRGLRDVTQVEANAERLGATKEIKNAIKSEQAEEETQAILQQKLLNLISQLTDNSTYVERNRELRSELSDLLKKSEESKNLSEQRVAHRVLQSVLIHTYEEAFALRQRKDYSLIPEKLEIAAAITPKESRVFYELAVAYSRIGNKSKAIAALKRAVENGFSDVSMLEANEELAPLRGDADYQKLIASLKKSG